MTWIALIQALTPGLVALVGAWRASSKIRREFETVRAEHVELRKEHAQCKVALDRLRVELGLKKRDETAGGGSLHRIAHAHDEVVTRPSLPSPITRKKL